MHMMCCLHFVTLLWLKCYVCSLQHVKQQQEPSSALLHWCKSTETAPKTTQEMDYCRSAKQCISAITQRHSPKAVERMVKTKFQFKQVKKKLQPYFLKTTGGFFSFFGKVTVSWKKKKNKQQKHFVLKTKILLSKVPFHQSALPRSSSEQLDQSCLKPGISIEQSNSQFMGEVKH